MPARASITDREHVPANVDAEIIAAASQPEAEPQTADNNAQPPGLRSNQFLSATRILSTDGMASKTARLLGEASTSMRASG